MSPLRDGLYRAVMGSVNNLVVFLLIIHAFISEFNNIITDFNVFSKRNSRYFM